MKRKRNQQKLKECTTKLPNSESETKVSHYKTLVFWPVFLNPQFSSKLILMFDYGLVNVHNIFKLEFLEFKDHIFHFFHFHI